MLVEQMPCDEEQRRSHSLVIDENDLWLEYFISLFCRYYDLPIVEGYEMLAELT